MSETSNLRLSDRLRERIRREGPISFYDWMQAALYDESAGYYCRPGRIRQGRSGDYRTAPEMSPLFAATFALYFSKLFADLKWPQSLTVFEAGAGGGEFAHGVLNSLRQYFPEIFAVTSYVIDEVSPAARLRAADRLNEFSDRITFQSLGEFEGPVPAGIIFSNEVIDAFPVVRTIMRQGRLRELLVGLSDGNFAWVEGDLDESVAEYWAQTGFTLAEGQIAEVNLDAEEFVTRAARLMQSGYLVTVDYGAERKDLLRDPNRRQGTLRGFRKHQLVDDVLATPGEHDLTTTVDWTQIIEAGERAGLRCLRLERLDQFFLTQDLTSVLIEMMQSAADAGEALRLSTSARDLIMPTGMAASFQVCVQGKVS